MALCFKCKENANIKINVLKYCNSCFIDLFESKIQKNIPKVSSDQSVLVLLPFNACSKIALPFLEKFFANRPIKSFKILSENSKLTENCPLDILDHSVIYNSLNPQTQSNIEVRDLFISRTEAINFCRNNNFSTLFVLESLNSIITRSLVDICSGDSPSALNNISPSFDQVKVFNILENIKTKELVYYMYLKKIPVSAAHHDVKNTTEKITETIRQFLLEIDDKNELAIFNTSNTLKKLSETK